MAESDSYRIEIEGDSRSLVESAKEASDALKQMGGVSNAVMTGMAMGAGQFIAGGIVKALSSIPGSVRDALVAFQDLTGKLADMSARTGVGTTKLQELAQAGKPVGIGMGQITSSIEMLKRRLDSAPQAFEKFGLSARELQQMSPDQAFLKIAAAVREIENPMMRSAAAIKLLGRSGSQMLPLLVSDIDQVIARNRELGIVMDEVSIKAGDELGDAMQLLDDTMKGFWNNVAAGIAKSPALHAAIFQLQNVFGALSNAVKDNHQTISDWVTFGVLFAVESVGRVLEVLSALGQGYYAVKTAMLSAASGAVLFVKVLADTLNAINKAAPDNPILLRLLGLSPEIIAKGRADAQTLANGVSEAFNSTVEAMNKSMDANNKFQDSMDRSRAAVEKAKLAIIAAKPIVADFNKALGGDGSFSSGFDEKTKKLIEQANKVSEIYAYRFKQDLVEDSIKNRNKALLKGLTDQAKESKAVVKGMEKAVAEEEKAAKKAKKVADIIKFDWSGALRGVSSVLSQIDSAFARVASSAMDVGAAFASGDISGMITGAFSLGNAIGEMLFGSGAEAEAAAALQQQLAEDAARAQNAYAEELKQKKDAEWDAALQAYDAVNELSKQISDLKKGQLSEGLGGLQSMFGAIGNGAAMSQERLDRMGRAGIAMFNALRKEGVSYMDAFQQMGPALDAAAQAAADSGLSLGGGFGQLNQFRQLVNAHQDLVSAAEGWGQVMEALRTSGSLDLGTFNDMMAEANAQFSDLTAAGFSEAQALSMMAPGLLQLQKAAAEQGFQLDPGTSALIEKAQSQGAFEGMVDPMEQLVELSNKMLEAFYMIAEVLGAELTPEMKKFQAEASGISAGSRKGDTMGSTGGGGGIIGGVPLPGFENGTPGVVDFGSGTPVVLHGRERVVPEDSGGGLGLNININVSASGTNADEIARQIRQQAAPELIRALRVAL